ncbi:MAG: TrkH family potassium uptake protein [Tannerellaceae bacterium]|jgi:trk system potassium uptake protein TrkH|nr:TrkH family potassium uptake protein [Tannerellaceae bacterium]
MLNIRFIIRMLGAMFLLETLFMLPAAGVAFFYDEADARPLLLSSAILFSAGLLFYLSGRRADEQEAGYREGMMVVALTWTLLSLFGMLPFYLGGYIDNITDAYFETMSGFTTTGASVLRNVESLPHGILLWRSLTQWQGGIGVVVFTVALLPLFGGGASQMFDAETTGRGIAHERFRPRVTQVAKRLSGVYLLLTALLSALLCMGPMEVFDAVNHALTTVSTGGYSTKNASVGYWHSSYTEYLISAFMLVGSVSMTLLYFFFRGNVRKLYADEELRWFLLIILVSVGVTAAWIMSGSRAGEGVGVEESFRLSLFHVISIISSTGFATTDYLSWGSFFWFIALILMFIGGCTGSTSGGLKVGRFIIIHKNLSNVFIRQMHPSAVLPVRMNRHVVSADNVYRCLAFTFVYMSLIVVGSLVLTCNGSDFDGAIGATLSAISNIGPGLGDHGPAGNYADMPGLSKWTLSFLMMVGRLEIFTVLTILLPGFWKQ